MKKILIFLLIFLGTSIAQAQNESGDSPLTSSLTIGVKITPPFIMETEAGGYTGLSIELWERIAKQLGISYKFKEYNFIELLEATENGQVDLSINPFSVTSEREEKMDFTQPFYVASLALAVATDQENSTYAFLKNFFSADFLKVVALLFIVIMIFGFLVWLAEKKHNEEFETGVKGLGHGIWWSAVTMTTVGYGDKSPRTLLGRVIGVIWMFTAVIIISSFTANIAATLTVKKIGLQIETVEDLKKISVGTVKKSSSAVFLNNHNVGFRAFKSTEEGVTALAFGKVKAFIYDEPILKHLIQENDLDSKIQLHENKFGTDYYSFSAPRNSRLLKQVNIALLKEIESPEWKKVLASYGLSQ
uniref:transporter substrate-binding domain-containing protein n=1 Tax=Candidatus Electrothrix sp. TaxID=2170559 RepID=UPI0040565395